MHVAPGPPSRRCGMSTATSTPASFPAWLRATRSKLAPAQAICATFSTTSSPPTCWRGDGIDIVADAQQLPFPAGAFDNIVMLDVLHHIPRPALFFDEAARVLKNGGRLVVIEPAITPGSYLVYRFFHPEPFDLSADPLRDAPLSSERPYDSNQAIPTLVATRRRQAFQQRYPELAIRDVRWLSFWAYPLTGGLRKWSLLSERMAKLLIRIEDQIPNYLGRWIAFRLMIVFQRQALQVDRTRLQEIV